jgi:hypothetical protein
MTANLTPMHERPEVEETLILIIEECSEVTKRNY